MSEKIPVKFIKGMSPYQAGEIAGFDKEFSQKLVDKKIASFVDKNGNVKEGKKEETPLTKEVYEQLKEEEKSDKEIYESFGFTHSKFYKMKKEWYDNENTSNEQDDDSAEGEEGTSDEQEG